MDISYIHTLKRKYFGQPCTFTDVGPNLLASIDPDPSLKAEFYVVPSVDKEVDNTVKMCLLEVNTILNPTQSRGMNHKEGGWPSGIEDEDEKARFRKKTEKNKSYSNAVQNLGARVENLLLENNSIDIYDEEYFANVQSKKPKQSTPFQTVSVALDPNDKPRKVMNISWCKDSSRVAGAYSIAGIRGKNTGVNSYVWDIQSVSIPYCVLKNDSSLNCVEFSPTDENFLLGGCFSGQVALWDIRVGGHAEMLSDLRKGHTQMVTGIKWLASGSRMEFFSVSTDGMFLRWDIRNLNEPTEKILLAPDAIPQLDKKYTASCVEYNESRPNHYMIGTEQGQVLSLSRTDNTESHTRFSRYNCQCSPVLTVGSNPFFPQLFASCDPCDVKLWVEKNTESPVLKFGNQKGFYTDFAWSPTRASVLYAAKSTGIIELWDVLDQHFRPRSCIQFGNDPLYSVSVNKTGELLACGTGSGKMHLMAIPEQFKSSSNIELSMLAISVGS